MKKHILFFIALLNITSIFAMEPSIIDYNEGETIDTLFSKPSIIGVFGATPRYSACEKYRNNLQRDFEYLCNNRRMKGVPRTTKTTFAELKENPGTDFLKNFLENANQDELMKLFLASGFDHAKHADNFKVLGSNITSHLQGKIFSKKEPFLVHILMPSYFCDLEHLKDGPEKTLKLTAFLAHTARHYQQLYRNTTECSEIPTYIIIPPVKHFTRMDSSSEISMANINVLREVLITNSKSNNGYILFDQNLDDLNSMVNYFHQEGFNKVGGYQLPLKNSRGTLTTKFNPYLIEEGKSYQQCNTPLFTKGLLTQLRTMHGENNE